MTESRRSFHDYLKEVPNPARDGKTKGTEEEFRRYAHEMAQAALARTGLELVEYDVLEFNPHHGARLKEIEKRPMYPEVKRNLGNNKVNPPQEDDGKERGKL